MAATTTIANINNDSINVDILFEKLEHDYDKNLIMLDIPKTADSFNDFSCINSNNS